MNQPNRIFNILTLPLLSPLPPPTLYMRKLRSRNGKRLGQGHSVNENIGFLDF
jgi:hypothetical protein